MKVALLISLRMSLTVSLLFLPFIPGVVAQDGWRVNYISKSICALKGSPLTMDCTYTPLSGHSVQKAFWTKELVTSGSEPPDLLDDPEYSGRVQYLGDEQRDCTLRFRNVREKDQSKYYFTFITDRPGGKYQGAGGVDLSVTDLQVEVPERVIEGGDVTLTCKTTCSLTVRPTFTWYRNGRPLSSSTDQLRLQPVSGEDAGRYHCAVLGLSSPEVPLNVRYPPKNISVSISPSGEIVEGRSVTLTCSSDANPPTQNYTWFKGTSVVAEGETYTMKKISSVDSGEYKCRSSNEHGEKLSAALTLNVLWGTGGLIKVLCIVLGVSVLLVALSCIVFCVRGNGKGSTARCKTQGNHYSNLGTQLGATTSDATPGPDPSNEDDVHYASVVPLRVRNPRNAESSAGTASGTDEVQYASIQHRRDEVVQKTEEDDVQYASVRFTRTGAANRPAVSTYDDASVIYSTLK
ncbi:hypothetical protein AOLI_G00235450 [Acnodon oligacanthus]